MIPQLQKAMTLPKGLTAAILVFLMLAAAITTAAAASGTPQSLNASLPENSPAGASLGTPMETNAPAGTVSYSLSGTDGDLFNIDPATGEITLAENASPDFETRAGYSVTITAAANLAVSVENIDEPGSVSLSTNSPRPGEALSAGLTDPDGSVSALSWRWQRSTEDGWEDIPGATAPDYTPGAGDVGRRLQAVAAYDDGSGEGRTAQAATGEPVRNDPPEFGADAANLAVDENTAPGATVGDPITATDPNGDEITYSLTGSADFTVDPQTGQIGVTEGAILDHEAASAHSLTLRARDIHGDQDEISVTVSVNNLDEPGTLSLSNTAPRAGDAITASLTDPDGQTTAETWQWRRDGINIPGATSSSYTATAADLGHTLSVTVSYEDPQGPGKSAQASADLPVSNDPPAFDTDGPVAMSIAEDAAIGTNVGEPLAATDPNSDPLAFALSGDGAGDFAVNQDGQITVAAALDHESRSSYSLTATVSDPAGGSGSTPVSITVENAEEPGAVVLGAGNQPQVGSEIAASLQDPDGGVNGESWQWQSSDRETAPWNDIAGADSASYTPQTGDIDRYLRAAVTYRDGHGSGQDRAQATTTHPVRPEPNRPPQFGDHTTTFNISINVREGVRVAPPFTAADPNEDTLTYSIVPSTPDAFTINPATGEVLMGSLEMPEGATFTASITVTDGRDDAGQEDQSPDDSLDLNMTIVNPNIVIQPSSTAAFPNGLWVDDDIVVTTNSGSRNWARYYDRDTQRHLSDRSFRIRTGRFSSMKGVWSDGDTLYVLTADRSWTNPRGKVFAYSLSDGSRQKSMDISLPGDNAHPAGLTGRDGIIYVADNRDRKVYAYNMETRRRQSGDDINGIDTLRKEITDLWTDGDTVWVSYWLSGFIRAYDMDTGERNPGLDVQLARENAGPTGIDSDGFNLWALDQVNDTIYGYVVPR